MRRALLILLVCWPLLGWAADAEVRVQSRLVPTTGVLVNGTVQMEVDLLVDTWFTAAPILPTLDLPGALVSPPSGEAEHLNQRLDGKTFFGLRYTYQITPQAAQHFVIPALEFVLQPGPASVPVKVHSQGLSFDAKAVAGGEGQQRLVAKQVTVSQQLQYSHQPLRVGDSVTRHVLTEADGALAMLIPPPEFGEIKGLKRYIKTPTITPLSNGRGGIIGGRREDVVSYVVTDAGQYSLPAIELSWW
ncbi:MAG: hypothetical protein AAGC84_15680, partial [Pseudomonas sp.]